MKLTPLCPFCLSPVVQMTKVVDDKVVERLTCSCPEAKGKSMSVQVVVTAEEGELWKEA